MKQKLTAYMEDHREDLIEDICRLVRIRSDKGEAKPGAPLGKALQRLWRKQWNLPKKRASPSPTMTTM